MSSHQHVCPIWDQIDNNLISNELIRQLQQPPPPPCISPRAGGPFKLGWTGIEQLKWLSETRQLTDRSKANLSYWIYGHNLRFRVFDEGPSAKNLIVLDRAWEEGHRTLTPSDEDRMLTIPREMIRKNDTGTNPLEESEKNLLMAAGRCCHDNDLWELQRDATVRGWLEGGDPSRIALPARTYVEEQLRHCRSPEPALRQVRRGPGTTRKRGALACGFSTPAAQAVTGPPITACRQEAQP